MTVFVSVLARFRSSLWVVTAMLFVLCHPAAANAPNVIFDSDMGSDIDDALALAMLHALEDRGEIKGHAGKQAAEAGQEATLTCAIPAGRTP